MIATMYEKIHSTSLVASIIISVALMLFSAYALTRITKKMHLPNVTAYIVAGILIGPYCLNLIPQKMITGMDFIADIALAFIAFSTGEYFRLDTLKKNGMKIVVLTIFESIVAAILVFAVNAFVLHLNMAFSIILGALASATAPAATIMVIRQTKSKGDFVNTLLQVVALDDVVGLVAYSVAISMALALQSGYFNIMSVIKPIAVNLVFLLLGGFFGFLMRLLIPEKRSTDNKLIISIAVLFSFCGICTIFGISPLLGCMAMGTVYVNTAENDKLFKQLNYFSPPILLMFFVAAGLNFRINTLFDTSMSNGGFSLLTIGIVYFFTRIIGKYIGSYLGCVVIGSGKTLRNCLGLALVPQAGVSIGLAALAARTLGGESGLAMQTIILSSSVLYELLGPIAAKIALYFSHSYSNSIEELTPEVSESETPDKPQNAVDVLIARINIIQQHIAEHDKLLDEEENIYTEAAEEHLSMVGHPHLAIRK